MVIQLTNEITLQELSKRQLAGYKITFGPENKPYKAVIQSVELNAVGLTVKLTNCQEKVNGAWQNCGINAYLIPYTGSTIHAHRFGSVLIDLPKDKAVITAS